MSYNYDSVRARIKNQSQKTGIKPETLYTRYFLERFIFRIAKTEHKDSVILKGGMLISAMAGVGKRATRDLDATVIGKALTPADFERIARDVAAVELDDNVKFQFVRMSEIMLDNHYPCYRFHLRATLGKMDKNLEIDMTSGDVLTPSEIKVGFPSLFGGEESPVLAYNIETILAEKINAILSWGETSTRPKDFYDIYLFSNAFDDRIDKAVLEKAVRNTLASRNLSHLLDEAQDKTFDILNSTDILEHWRKYQNEYAYAKDIPFGQVLTAWQKILGYAGIDVSLQEPIADQIARGQKLADAHNANLGTDGRGATANDEPDL